MKAFLCGSAPLGAASPSNNYSALYTRSGQLPLNASFANSNSFRQDSEFASPFAAPSTPHLNAATAPAAPAPIAASISMAGESPLNAVEAENATPLTVVAVKRYVRLQRQLEDREIDRISRQAERAAVFGIMQQRGEPSGQELESTTVDQTGTQGDDEDTDSEELDVYTARTERQVWMYLNDLQSEDFTLNPAPVPAAVEDELAGQSQQEKEHINSLSVQELRALVLEMDRELLFTLYDAVTLEANLAETDEDAAVLERAVGDRDERIALLKAQLNTAVDENVDLLNGRRDALRKLSEAKTEMALLSQRNAKLLKQLDLKADETQMSHTTSFNGSRQTFMVPVERKDVGTLTEVIAVRRDTNQLSGSASGADAAIIDESPLSLGNRSKSVGMQHELEETQEELKLVRDTLYETEMQRIQLQEQLQELKAATVKEFSDNDKLNNMFSYGEQRRRDEHSAALYAAEERCEKSEQHAASLEDELRNMREELRAMKAKVEEGEKRGNTTAIAQSTEEHSEVRVAPSSGAATPAHSASPARTFETLGSSTGPASAAADATDTTTATNMPNGAARFSLSQQLSVSMEAQMIVLQRQLARARAEAARFEQELHAEREKTERQAQSGKRLLENVTLLTRQLRAHEALEREARLIRRTEASTAREVDNTEGRVGGGDAAPSRELRRSRLPTSRSNRDDVPRRESTVGAAASSSEADGAVNSRRELRSTTPELGRRRESIFTALRNMRKTPGEPRHNVLDIINRSTASLNPDPNRAQDIAATTSQQEAHKPEPQPQVPTESKEEPKIMLHRAKVQSPSPQVTTAKSTTANATAEPTLALSMENPSVSASSHRVSRLSVMSLVSSRGPRSGSFASVARDSSADCVCVENAPHSVSLATTIAPVESEPVTALPAAPQRQAVARESVAATSRADEAHAGCKVDNTSKQTTTTIAASTATNKLSPFNESMPFDPPEANTISGQPPQHHVFQGQSCARPTSSAHPTGVRSSSVGASVHRGSVSLSVPSTAPTAAATTATSNATTATFTPGGGAATATKGASIMRGLTATTSGPVATPRKRTASRRIVTGRDAKTSSNRDGSTAVLR